MSVYDCFVCGGEVDGDASVILAGEHPGEYYYEPFFEDLRTDITRVMHSECLARQQGVGALVDAIHSFYVKERSGVRKLNDEIGRLRRQLGAPDQPGAELASLAGSADGPRAPTGSCTICSAEIARDGSAVLAFGDPEEYQYVPFLRDLQTKGTRLMHPQCFAAEHGARTLVEVVHAEDRRNRDGFWRLIDERDSLRKRAGERI
jgi:hypothetical protein